MMLEKLHLVWDSGEGSSGEPKLESAENSRYRVTEAERHNPGIQFLTAIYLATEFLTLFGFLMLLPFLLEAKDGNILVN